MKRLYISAFTISMGYVVSGLIPLLHFFIMLSYSVVVTGIVLLVFGAIKVHVTGSGRGMYLYIWSTLSTLLIGGVASVVAFKSFEMNSTL